MQTVFPAALASYLAHPKDVEALFELEERPDDVDPETWVRFQQSVSASTDEAVALLQQWIQHIESIWPGKQLSFHPEAGDEGLRSDWWIEAEVREGDDVVGKIGLGFTESLPDGEMDCALTFEYFRDGASKRRALLERLRGRRPARLELGENVLVEGEPWVLVLGRWPTATTSPGEIQAALGAALAFMGTHEVDILDVHPGV